MEGKKIGISRYGKMVKACPLPPMTVRVSFVLDLKKIEMHWKPRLRWLYAVVFAFVAGIVLILMAYFVPPIVYVDIVYVASGSIVEAIPVVVIGSLIFSPLPFILSLIIGLVAAACIPLYDYHAGRRRIFTASIFGVLYSLAFEVDHSKISFWQHVHGPSFGLPPLAPYTLGFMLTPGYWILFFLMTLYTLGFIITLISVLTSFFGEFLWNFIVRSPITGPSTGHRRTAIPLKGQRGTVLSVDHKGGYFKGMAKPSKWQSYERDEPTPNRWAKRTGGWA